MPFSQEQLESHRGFPPFFAVGEHPALDFLNSSAAPRKVRTEWIGDGESLLNWLDAMQLVSAAEALSYFPAEQFDAVAAAARDLREEVRALTVDAAAGKIDSAALQHTTRLNKILAADNRLMQLSIKDGHFDATKRFRWQKPAEVLLPVADAVTDLFCHGDFALIRQCDAPRCSLWFYDRTKGHRRRWCTTTVCGNKAKVAAFRARNPSAS
jgi:predicted RNA-binding Zn ribbon-like protein